MSRGLEVDAAVASTAEPIEPLLALLTQLGDAWFLLAVGLAAYWLGVRRSIDGWDHRRGLLVIGVAVWALTATYLLKTSIGLPRPTGAARPAYAFDGLFGLVYADAATATGFGFPSGHAAGASAVYGTIAWLVRGDRPVRRLGAAAGLVGLVGFTRVGLGLHYLVDVVAGVALGVALVAVTVRFVARPGTVLALAALTAVGRALVGPVGPKTAALVGMSTGALVTWVWLARSGGPSERSLGHPVRQLLPVMFSLGAVLVAVLIYGQFGIHPAGVALATLGGGVLFVSLPVALWSENVDR